MTGYNSDWSDGSETMVQLHGYGRVRLLDWVGDDERVVYAARRSYQSGTQRTSTNTALIRRLMRHRHTSPFEHVRFTFEVDCELFTFGQWVRHRMGSFSVLSFRYSEAENRFYLPDNLRLQDKRNRQGSDGLVQEDVARDLLLAMHDHNRTSLGLYRKLLAAGVCREQARMVLPQSVYTNFVWSVDLHNLFNFLKLRLDHHAQWEIQQFAAAIEKLVYVVAPECIRAWQEYQRDGVMMSERALTVVRNLLANLSPVEVEKQLRDVFPNDTEYREVLGMLGYA